MRSLILVFLFFCSCPSMAQYNFYFGNLHSHTAYSDGNKDSATVFCEYPGCSFNAAKTSYHMDFLGISEHNHFSSTNNPGMHVADYAKGVYQADTANKNGSFVCMFGFEWGVISNGGHVVTYGVPGLVGWEKGSGAWGSSNNYDIYCAKSDYSSFWKIVNGYPGAFSVLAHPQDDDYNGLVDTAATFNFSADSAVTGIAIRSGDAFSATNDYSDVAPTLYQAKYFSALAKGYYVGPTCDHDNHYTNFGKTNKTRTVILAKALNKDSLMSAMKQRRFYATDDWNTQVTFSVNGNIMGSKVILNSNSSINVTVYDPDAGDNVKRIDIYYGIPGSNISPVILTTQQSANTLNYIHTTIVGDKYYYLAKITQTDGDYIWTAPVWVTHDLNTVPIRLNNFTVTANESAALLKWQTETANNISRFEVENSVDGTEFSTIYSTRYFPEKKEYSYTHNNVKDGINYYRIKIFNKDGSFDYSAIIAVLIKNPEVRIFSITPNPVWNILRMHCNSAIKENITVRIYNLNGKEIRSMLYSLDKGDNILYSDVSDFPSGTYMIVLSKPNMRISEGRFIKL